MSGSSVSAEGVVGSSDSGTGVSGSSTSSIGVAGATFGASVGTSGIDFSERPGEGIEGTSVLGTGVVGFSFSNIGVLGSGTIGVLGQGRRAGVFQGNVTISGTLSKAGGGFEIDHPLDPEGKYLRHSFVESPDMLNIYSGNVVSDDNGEAVVTLPDYFEVLNRDFRYQLSVIGSQFARAIVSQEVRNNQFVIKTDEPRVKVSWQVSGIRQDRWATANGISVEEEKNTEDRGYLHPELWSSSDDSAEHRRPRDENRVRRILEDQPRRVSKVVPAAVRQQVEQFLEAVLQGGQLDRDELQSLVVRARHEAELLQAEPPHMINRSRLEDEWRQIEQMVRQIWPAAPGMGDGEPESSGS
ncbi:hypothetical protein ABZ897_35775 [Nonomuraea sp. NPDC046802]|uniref:hypothetical protein n=1 Tax=Nonomuraea sp. NPDC046802 TaxID=3154919 RepID=UPI00341167EB